MQQTFGYCNNWFGINIIPNGLHNSGRSGTLCQKSSHKRSARLFVLWSSGDILDTFPGIISGYGFADGITDVLYRGNLEYIPGFQVYVHYVGCKTELLSSAWNITHRTSLSLILLHGVLIGV